jgi:hypothetical protein
MRSVLAVPLEFARSNVPLEFTVMLVVLASLAVVDPALSILSVPAPTVVAPL